MGLPLIIAANITNGSYFRSLNSTCINVEPVQRGRIPDSGFFLSSLVMLFALQFSLTNQGKCFRIVNGVMIHVTSLINNSNKVTFVVIKNNSISMIPNSLQYGNNFSRGLRKTLLDQFQLVKYALTNNNLHTCIIRTWTIKIHC